MFDAVLNLDFGGCVSLKNFQIIKLEKIAKNNKILNKLPKILKNVPKSLEKVAEP